MACSTSAFNLILLAYVVFSVLCTVVQCDNLERPQVKTANDEEDLKVQNSMDDVQVIIPTERPATIPPSEVIIPKRQQQHKDAAVAAERNIHEGHKIHEENRFDYSDDKSTADDNSLSFFHGFIASLSVILVSELGDKTFFIAAIMAMRHSRVTVFTGAIGALALMTILSAVFGMAANLIPKIYTYYISTLLFVIFGLKMLRDGLKMSEAEAQEEFEEVQMDLKKREDEYENRTNSTDVEASVFPLHSGGLPFIRHDIFSVRQLCFCLFPLHILVQSFSMTFVAEWGDRSQLTTIILGARENVPGVIIGGILGHSFCTGLAVIGGRMIAQRISVKTVTIVGGIVFLLFAFSALIFNNSHDD